LLAGADFPPAFHIAGSIASVLIVSLFLILYASMRLWNRAS
jgi:hypothetical protein